MTTLYDALRSTNRITPDRNYTDEWHILHVMESDDDDEATLYHTADCPMSIMYRGKNVGYTSEHECGVAHQIDNAGFYGLFDSSNDLKPGWWRIRPWIEKIVGPTWTEWDGGWEVEPFITGMTEEDANF